MTGQRITTTFTTFTPTALTTFPRDDDVIVDMDILKGHGAEAGEKTGASAGGSEGGTVDAGGEPKVLIVTTNGFGKRSPVKDFSIRKRGGMGVIATKFKVPRVWVWVWSWVWSWGLGQGQGYGQDQSWG